MAIMATRNTLTSVRPMISAPWAFCEPIIYGNIILQKRYSRLIFRENLAKV